MREYELYVPLFYNDGSPIEPDKISQIGERLLQHFGGVTFFPQPNEGSWKMGQVTFRDQIVIFRVLSAHSRRARQFLKDLKQELRAELKQEEILVVEKKAEIL